MLARRLGLLSTVAAVVVLAAQGAYATGGGNNTGVSGFVFNTVTVGGVTFSGSCQYSMTTRVTITGHATAASTPPVAATSITCTVEHAGPVPPSVSSATMAGPAVTTNSTGQLQVRGSAICITMSAVAADGSTANAGEFCVS
jgi:hypothetical protein